MRLSKAEKQILRAAINRARIEVRKSGVPHIEQALRLVNGPLTPKALKQAYKHLFRAMTEHSRVAQPLLVARAAVLTVAAALGLRKGR
jgi:hypothetical protein